MTTSLPPAVERARVEIEAWFRAGLEAVDPYLATTRVLSRTGNRVAVADEEIELTPDARVIGLAIGKAASPMARALEDVLGDLLVQGIVLTKDGHLDGAPPNWEVHEASHPVPDERGVAATRRIIDSVANLSGNDVVFVLVSGGGSALLESPREPLELQDIQVVTDLLLRAGAPIQDLNAVRSELSEVKGGGLRRRIGEATCVSLILSDVLGNDPTVVASGPTVPRVPNPARATALLHHYGVADRVPTGIMDLLRVGSSIAAVDTSEHDIFDIVGDNATFVEAVASAAQSSGFRVNVALVAAEGEARTLADRFLTIAGDQSDEIDVVLGGGEATVTVSGGGTGGRNTEFALAAALRLAEEESPWVVASLASDGQDGSVDAAGAIVDASTVERGDLAGLSADAYLGNNDTGRFLKATDDLMVTGPTGTNVNDVYIAVRLNGPDLSK